MKISNESYSEAQETWAGRIDLRYYQKGLGLLTCDSGRIILEAFSPHVLCPGFESLTYPGPRCLTQVLHSSVSQKMRT